MELGALADDPRFATNARRVENRIVLDDIIVPMLASRPAAYWLERLHAADILCGPINNFADVVQDATLSAALPLVDPLAANVPRAVGLPMRFNGHYTATCRPAPAKGEHTHEILAECGYSADEVQAFLRTGAVFSLEHDTETAD
jgi:formyl-CoA transferase